MFKAHEKGRGARRIRFAALASALVAGALVTVLAGEAGAGETAWPSEVTARYKLSFNGFDVGTYDFASHYNGSSYDTTGKTQISALFGAFKWSGNFSSTGSIGSAGPRPSSFDMAYKAKSKTTSVKLTFDTGAISSIVLVPNKPPKPDAIPVKPDHLKNVFDPMSAILAMWNANGTNACNRTIPVFDGKARFDLKLSFKKREAVKDKKPTGLPPELVVCRVKYIPIAGHRPKDFTNPWVDYDNIEIALRAVPSAGIYVPYRVTVPSPVGSAVMDADAINITAGDNVQIALRQ